MQRLLTEEGAVRGVRYRDTGGWHEVRAALTVAADGRFSRVRKLALAPGDPLAIDNRSLSQSVPAAKERGIAC